MLKRRDEPGVLAGGEEQRPEGQLPGTLACLAAQVHPRQLRTERAGWRLPPGHAQPHKEGDDGRARWAREPGVRRRPPACEAGAHRRRGDAGHEWHQSLQIRHETAGGRWKCDRRWPHGRLGVEDASLDPEESRQEPGQEPDEDGGDACRQQQLLRPRLPPLLPLQGLRPHRCYAWAGGGAGSRGRERRETRGGFGDGAGFRGRRVWRRDPRGRGVTGHAGDHRCLPAARQHRWSPGGGEHCRGGG
mmetsp:Transcript_29273/g.59538  ORF Transcript_29273/g.59538 Transcript_29273/m.59538 type:complete len:246 (+) Transcript_29273:88-825(+)